ncbi:TPA: right-handed parallel beta-helix repeat-containing protein [Streptococcus suis]|nr:right-handed parallel beta-helix repeat-containing protein [Streptococcus suis]
MNKKIFLNSAIILLSVTCFTGSVDALDNSRVIAIPSEIVNSENAYNITLKAKTDGVESDLGGSIVSENGVLSGSNGTKINLKITTNPGYRFVGYQSFLENGNSTDGLLPIENDSFEISDKTGNVTVIAIFESVPVDESIYFSDDFSVENINNYVISENLVGKIGISDGKMNLQAPGISSIKPILTKPIEDNATSGYEIGFTLQQIGEVKPWNTFRIVFKEDHDGFIYALEFSGQAAFLKKLSSIDAPLQSGEKYAETSHILGSEEHKVRLVVKGNSVTVSDNGIPLLSYNSPNNWNDAQASIVFSPVSNRSVSLDDIIVRRTQTLRPFRVVSRLDGQEVSGVLPGSIKGTTSQVFVGDSLNLEVIEKSGYQFIGFKDSAGNFLDLTTFVVPNEESELVLYADFESVDVVIREPKTFYIDSLGGNDSNNGETENSAWKSFEQLRKKSFVAGDRILIKRGSRFVGESAFLTFKGSGSQNTPILISSYGEGELPLLEGQGKIENVIKLYNQEFITIENLEITNLDPNFSTSFELNSNNNRTKSLRGLHVVAEDYGVVHDINIRNLYIHDINGNLSSKWNGGIFFDVYGTTIPTKYDGILIENNYLERVDRSGIKLVGSTWANQNLKNNKNVPLNWYPSTNVVVRGNRIEKAGGDSLTVRDTDGALIEYNISADARYQNTGYNAGIWPFQASNTVIQYNESFRTHGVQDGQGLDLDHISNNSVMQYNYSHDNEGGFMLIMNWYEQTSPTVRYNISQNDKDKIFELARGGAQGTAIYNNTIYSDSKLTGRAGVIDMPSTSGGTGVKDIFLFNNIFYFVDGEKMLVEASDAGKYKDNIHFYNNAYVGVEVPNDPRAITEGIELNGIGTGPIDNKSMIANTGKYLTGQLDGYKIPFNSVLANSGVSKEDAITYFYEKLGIQQQIDFIENGSLNMSPIEAFSLARQTNSIDAIARSYPKIDGVNYDIDFFGESILTDNLSIGAAQVK